MGGWPGAPLRAPRGWFCGERVVPFEQGMPRNDKGGLHIGWGGGRNMCRLQPPTRFPLWFGKCSPLSVSSEYERQRERVAYFFPSWGRRADHRVNEKESHLERRGGLLVPRLSFPVAAHPSQVPHLQVELERLPALGRVLMLYRGVYSKGLTAPLCDCAGCYSASEGCRAWFNPVIFNGLVICFLCAELETQSYFLPSKHPGQIRKEGNVHRKGLTLSHPPTHLPTSLHPSPTALVAIATEEEVGIFKGQAAAQGILEEITVLSTPCYWWSERLLWNTFVTNIGMCPAGACVLMSPALAATQREIMRTAAGAVCYILYLKPPKAFSSLFSILIAYYQNTEARWYYLSRLTHWMLVSACSQLPITGGVFLPCTRVIIQNSLGFGETTKATSELVLSCNTRWSGVTAESLCRYVSQHWNLLSFPTFFHTIPWKCSELDLLL